MPREVAAKLGPTWFWSGKAAPVDRLPGLIARAASAHANLLVDVPPRPDGTIPPHIAAASGNG
jgi:hypothetical protein